MGTKEVNSNWSGQQERGSSFWLVLAVRLYRLLGRRLTLALIAPAVLFFLLTGRSQREASRRYLERAWQQGLLDRKPSAFTVFRHFMVFTGSILDRIGAWSGEFTSTDIEGADDASFYNAKFNGKGGIVLTSHVGNPELLRAVATVSKRFAVTVLMHTAHAEQFNRVMAHFSPEHDVRVLQVGEINIGTAMTLSETIARGEWVVMAADRLRPGAAPGEGMPIDFLGSKAPFPTGPAILAAALKCPVHFLACTRQSGSPCFRLHFSTLRERLELPRGKREAAIRVFLDDYAQALEAVLAEAPMAWFNFYDFWHEAATLQEPASE
ncbi:MAG: lipid A biosynthesis acyltransferase [Gammaproteobacteria bacterium]|nr:MAG: lipid A biosynthesis acyltransferase [Gammaproteobacteria bacterium]